VDIGRGGCSATVELVLALGLVPSSDLIISRHLAGKARVLSLHYSTTNPRCHVSLPHTYHHDDDPADACPTLLGPFL
jgi:hypothetical protein